MLVSTGPPVWIDTKVKEFAKILTRPKRKKSTKDLSRNFKGKKRTIRTQKNYLLLRKSLYLSISKNRILQE